MEPGCGKSRQRMSLNEPVEQTVKIRKNGYRWYFRTLRYKTEDFRSSSCNNTAVTLSLSLLFVVFMSVPALSTLVSASSTN